MRLARAAAVVLLGWLIGGFLRWWEAPLIGWLALPVLAGAGAWTSWRASRIRGPAGRFWLAIAIASVLLGVGSVSAGKPSQHFGPVALACFIGAFVVTQWGLVRLPGKADERGSLVQLTLDSGTVMVTVALFAWHFSFRNEQAWVAVTGSFWPSIAAVVFGCASIVTLVRIASIGIGQVDAGALRILAGATATAAAAGTLSPWLSSYPAINDAELTVPISCFCIAWAANRQLHATEAVVRPARRRRWSIVPYAAVAAAYVLLVVAGRGTDATVLIWTAALLTTLVVVRQIIAFLDNSRLVEQLRDARDQLAAQATLDDLTGLGNRRVLQTRMSEARMVAGPESIHLVLVDLDDFKAVNDRLGHHVGDALLTSFGARLLETVGDGQSTERIRKSTVVRLGGDEFAVLLISVTADEADEVAHDIARTLQRPLPAGEHELLVRASIGVADGALEPRELLRRADVAMYAAKARGKQRVARFTPAMDRDANEDARMSADLGRALAAGDLHLVYQPIVELPSGKQVSAEALVRWGDVPPQEFIPVAERSGLIVQLGVWILREVCLHSLTLPGTQKVSVNVSARQLRDPEFPATVEAVIAETGADPCRLVVEVTETAVFDDGTALASVHALHGLGITIALDDFGTGHSSLGLLRTCPVDVLKVDKSFVDEIADGGAQAVIAIALIQIAEGLGLQAIAEGVETAAQAEQLHKMGYRYAQGYYFSRPIIVPAIPAQRDGNAPTPTTRTTSTTGR